MPENGIAVVCPTFNCKDYINQTLNTILCQKNKPEEVIFSDDGSNDNTLEIIEQNRDRFTQAGIDLKVLHNPHEGPGAARNHGVLATDQPWVAFLDADDNWKPEKLLRIRQTISQYPEVNCILHWEEYLRADGSLTTLQHGEKFKQTLPISKQLYQNNFLSTSAVVCRLSLLLEVECFDVTLPNSQDYDLWLKMSPIMKIKIIPEIQGTYLEKSTSISARPYYKRVFSNLRIALRHRDKGNFWLLLWKIVRILISKQWFYTLNNLIQRKPRHNH